MSNALRKIAEQELEQCFRGLNAATRGELATSLVRQWIGCGGNAVIVTRDFHCWFRLKKLDDGPTQVMRDRQPQTFVDQMRKGRVVEAQIPILLHELSVRQSAECMTDYGQKVRLRVDPAKPMFFIELVLDGEEWHRYPNG
jgi:hypothetical protein